MPDIFPIPFSKRTTVAVAVFACIGIASPQGPIQKIASDELNVPILTALQLEYAQLINIYPLLIHQDTANNQADLYSAIDKAAVTVANLNATIDSMMASSDAGVVLADNQIVVANALTAIRKVQNDE